MTTKYFWEFLTPTLCDKVILLKVSSHLDNLNQNFGCPIKPAKCEVVLTAGGRGKWCKILHSGHILVHKSQLQIGFFYWNVCLTSHKAPKVILLKVALNTIKQTISLKENINYVPTDVYTQGWRIYMYFNPNICQMWNVLNLIM
jgi:hypothetical protein